MKAKDNKNPGDNKMNGTIKKSVTGNSAYEMPDHVFSKFTRLIYDESGIKLNEGKKVMLASRLNKRLKALGISTYTDYYDYLFSSVSSHDEIHMMIDVVSTNKTDFFREDSHFDFLRGEAMPSVISSPSCGNDGTINIWSAGCSSGEEPYTIALVCAEYFGGCSGKFRILATDISNRVLETAKNAVYPDSIVENVPSAMLRKYFMMGTGNKTGYHKVVPELREKVVIKRHNLVNDNFKSIPRMDMIFCRNVVIYFDRDTQNKLYQKLFDHLNRGGYFFIGHSESLYKVSGEIQRIAPTIYRKLG